MNFRILSASIITVIATVGASNATVLQYTDRTAYESALASLSTEDFTGFSGTFTTRDFGDFTATRTGSSITMSNVGTDVELQMRSGISSQNMNWTFDSAINGIGFDWRNTDPTGDQIELIFAGQTFNFGAARQSGFFGVIDTMNTHTVASLSDTPGNGGVLSSAFFDDVTYGTTTTPVPLPASAPLVFAGLAAFGLMKRRKKYKQ